MALYLVQHGKSVSKSEDADQPLSDNGYEKTELMAKLASEKGIEVGKIIHSKKTRAIQTAQIFMKYLKPEHGIDVIKGLNPNDPVERIGNCLKSESNLMIVGHIPFLERLTSYLITGRNDLLIMKFQNSGIICLDMEQNIKTDKNHTWFIKWTLMPEVK